MEEKIQDKIISFEDCKEYNISYPVIIKRWEIRQVNGLNKNYLQVYFQKIDDSVKAFKFNVKCYSAFDEQIDNITEITIQAVDKKNIEFTEIVSLKSEISKVEIHIMQALMLDDTVIEPQGNQIVVNTFKPFNDEELEIAQQFLSSAKGLPIDESNHWFCSCSQFNKKENKVCLSCKVEKNLLFESITYQNILRERKKEKGLNFIAVGIAFFTLLSMLFPILVKDFSINGFSFLWFGEKDYLFAWTPIAVGIFSWLQLLISIFLIVVNILCILKFKKNSANFIACLTTIICSIFALIYTIVGVITALTFTNGYKTFSYFSIILYFIFAVIYLVYAKLYLNNFKIINALKIKFMK